MYCLNDKTNGWWNGIRKSFGILTVETKLSYGNFGWYCRPMWQFLLHRPNNEHMQHCNLSPMEQHVFQWISFNWLGTRDWKQACIPKLVRDEKNEMSEYYLVIWYLNSLHHFYNHFLLHNKSLSSQRMHQILVGWQWFWQYQCKINRNVWMGCLAASDSFVRMIQSCGFSLVFFVYMYEHVYVCVCVLNYEISK